MTPEFIQIPYSTYQNILNHLQVHCATDAWANSCLEELQQEAKPSRQGRTASGAEAAGWSVNSGLQGKLMCDRHLWDFEADGQAKEYCGAAKAL